MNKQKKFNLNNNFKNIFDSTDPADKLKGKSILNISIEELVPFKNHPFKLYEGERFTDMVESIKENGIIMPIIVRPLDEGIYEILSGHNRVEAAKSAGLETVPAIVRGNLSDEEAMLIVTETNLHQRGFESLTHSERAAALSTHYNAIKSQGRRNDLINEINELLNSDKVGVNETSPPVGTKLRSDEKTGNEYGLSKNSVARYLRVNKLNKDLKERVDNEEISIRAAVEISYIPEQIQSELASILSENPEFKIDIKKAELIRGESEKDHFDRDSIYSILSGQFMEVKNKKRNRASLPIQSLKIGGKKLSKYFKPEQKPEEIETELFKALEFYRANKKED